MKFGRKEGALFGALLAGVGCASEEAESKDIEDLKQDSANVEIYKGEEVINPEDDGFVVPGEKNEISRQEDLVDQDVDLTEEAVEEKDPSSHAHDRKEKTIQEPEKKKVEPKEGGEEIFENYLLAEAQGLYSTKDLPGFSTAKEAKRILPKLAKKYSKHMFADLPVLVEKHFRPLVKDKEYAKEVDEHVKKYCEQYGVPISILRGVIGVESGGDNDLKSNRDAYGICQVKQIAADHLRKMKFNVEDWKGVDIKDLEDNIRVGAAYLRYVYDSYGQWGLALMAYNTGPGNFRSSTATRLYRYQMDAYSRGDLKEKPKKWNVGKRNVRDEKTGEMKKVFVDEVKKKYPGGWPAFLRDSGVNMTSACSKNGLGMCERGYGNYPFHVLFLSETVSTILESDDKNIKLDLITKNI
ncbi:transglycosylase SLT domain-containing protein [Patescibacteria group bacterium]|nr:transglycosylase SLT domain-containing protein [Patescibacteria group bacterium]